MLLALLILLLLLLLLLLLYSTITRKIQDQYRTYCSQSMLAWKRKVHHHRLLRLAFVERLIAWKKKVVIHSIFHAWKHRTNTQRLGRLAIHYLSLLKTQKYIRLWKQKFLQRCRWKQINELFQHWQDRVSIREGFLGWKMRCFCRLFRTNNRFLQQCLRHSFDSWKKILLARKYQRQRCLQIYFTGWKEIVLDKSHCFYLLRKRREAIFYLERR